MPRAFQKLAVSEREAAHLLSLPTSIFKDLVRDGALPGPSAVFGDQPRWSVAKLSSIVDGSILDDEEFLP